jgi:hypothetical protein
MTQKKTFDVDGNDNLRPLSYVRQNNTASINRLTYEKRSKETEQKLC